MLPLPLRNLAINVPCELGLQPSIDQLFLRHEKRLAQPDVDDEALEQVLPFSDPA